MGWLLALAGWATALFALAGAALALALLLSPELRSWPMELLERHLFPDANQVLLQHKKGASAPRPAGGHVLRILAFGDSLTEGFTRCGPAAATAWQRATCACCFFSRTAGALLGAASSRNARPQQKGHPQ